MGEVTSLGGGARPTTASAVKSLFYQQITSGLLAFPFLG